MIKLISFTIYSLESKHCEFVFENSGGYETTISTSKFGEFVVDKSEGFTVAELQDIFKILENGKLEIYLKEVLD